MKVKMIFKLSGKIFLMGESKETQHFVCYVKVDGKPH
jgi:hypothetical protein